MLLLNLVRMSYFIEKKYMIKKLFEYGRKLYNGTDS